MHAYLYFVSCTKVKGPPHHFPTSLTSWLPGHTLISVAVGPRRGTWYWSVSAVLLNHIILGFKSKFSKTKSKNRYFWPSGHDKFVNAMRILKSWTSETKQIGQKNYVPPERSDRASKNQTVSSRFVVWSDVKDGIEDSLLFSLIKSIIVARLLRRSGLVAQFRDVMNLPKFPPKIEEYTCYTSSNRAIF